MYRFTDSQVEEVRGTFNGIGFPFVHNWTYFGKECGAVPNGFAQPPEITGADTTAVTTKLKITSKPTRMFEVEPVGVCSATTWPDSIVQDTRNRPSDCVYGSAR